MPGSNETSRGFGGLGTVRNFARVAREVRFDEVREQAEQTPRLIVMAPDTETAERLGNALTGEQGSRSVSARALDDQLRDAGAFDAVIVYDPEATGAIGRARNQVPTLDGPAPVFAFMGTSPDDKRTLQSLRTTLVKRLPERGPALGRAFEPFRMAAAKAVIDETAKANAQFALVSNVPAVIPIVGSIAAAGADFIVLTKNQVMMLFKIAAINGRDLSDQRGIIQEMVPVVGAALGWRTLARGGAAFLPFAAGTIPKVAIAYAGTVTVGRTADFYYRMGKKPTRAQMMEYYRQGAEAVKKLPLPGIRNGKKADVDRLPGDETEPIMIGEGTTMARVDDGTETGQGERADTPSS